MNRFSFPQNTHINRIISKERVFKQVSPTEKIKQRFTSQVERIRCLYEITADKINLTTSKSVPKIFVVQITAKRNKIDNEIIATIDRAFMVPVIFEVVTSGGSYYCVSFRRRNEADKSKWVFSGYFRSGLEDKEEQDLPIVLSMEALYHSMIETIIPNAKRQVETVAQMIERIETANIKQKQADGLRNRIDTEKQYNRRVELNRQYKNLIADIESLLSI